VRNTGVVDVIPWWWFETHVQLGWRMKGIWIFDYIVCGIVFFLLRLAFDDSILFFFFFFGVTHSNHQETQQNWPCLFRWKARLKSTVCWFIVREKHCTMANKLSLLPLNHLSYSPETL
jgi:hypothetical protein